MTMARVRHADAAREIEVALPRRGVQVNALAAVNGVVDDSRPSGRQRGEKRIVTCH